VARYSATVSRQLAPKLDQKPSPARSIAGKTKNIGSDGSTYQNVDSAWAAIRSTSLVSRRSQRMASRLRDFALWAALQSPGWNAAAGFRFGLLIWSL